MVFTRILTFRSNNLGKDSNLVLTFDDSETNKKLYKDVFPTALKVTTFGETGPYEFTLVYKSDIGFTRVQLEGDIVVPAATYTHIDLGQETTLKKRGPPTIYSFTTPQDIVPKTGLMEAVNGTDHKEDIGVGFFTHPDRSPSQALVFPDVGPGSKVQCEFTPVLRGYVTSDYQESTMLKGQIRSPLLFKEDLIELRDTTHWKIELRGGVYTIKPADR